jgi:putative ABC transport system ATP-binding protein
MEYNISGRLIEALKDVNLEVAENEFIVVSGHSGAGKTTLLNIIGGLDKPTSGEINVFNHDLAVFDEEFLSTFRAAYVGYVFQSYNLISTLTTQENIIFPMQLVRWSDDKVMKQSEKLLKFVELEERADHFPSQLSGGEQQRAAFARALANDPPLLLIDEPTGNLDLETGLKIIKIIEGLKGEKTVVVVTHDIRIVDLADRKLVLSHGRIV